MLRKEGFIWTQFEGGVHHIGEAMIAGSGGSWSQQIYGQEAERWIPVLNLPVLLFCSRFRS